MAQTLPLALSLFNFRLLVSWVSPRFKWALNPALMAFFDQSDPQSHSHRCTGVLLSPVLGEMGMPIGVRRTVAVGFNQIWELGYRRTYEIAGILGALEGADARLSQITGDVKGMGKVCTQVAVWF